MIIVSIGLPGRLAEWCDAAVARVAAHLGGTVASKAWPSITDMFGYEGISSVLDEAALTLIRTGAAHLVMGARQPDERLRATLAETNTRFIVGLDDPRVAVADILAATNAETRSVTRAIANSCPLVMRYGTLPGALAISGREAADDAAATIAAIARHLEITIGEPDAKAIADELAASGLTWSGTGVEDWPASIADPEKSMVDGALAGYARSFAGSGIGQIVWTRDLFIVASDPNKKPTDILDVSDVSGDDRFLIYGPYIHLPPGSWTARVILGLSQEAAGHTLIVDAYAGKPLARTSFQPLVGGIYAPEITFSLDEATGQGIEIRVLVGSDNAKGQLAFGNVVLSRVSTRHPDGIIGSRGDFRAALEL